MKNSNGLKLKNKKEDIIKKEPLELSLFKIFLLISFIILDGALAGAAGHLALDMQNTDYKPQVSAAFKPVGNISDPKIAADISKFSSCGEPAVKDINGNIYNTVKIGAQCWMKENLKVTKNPKGKSIIRYCYSDDAKNCEISGGLYDWNTIMAGAAGCNGASDLKPGCLTPVQGICPTGWHIPSHFEWTLLEKNSGSRASAFLYDDTTIGWLGKNEGATLKSGGFGMVFGGERELFGSFENNERIGFFWSSTEGSDGVWYRTIHIDDPKIYRDMHDKGMGLSVRCVKN